MSGTGKRPRLFIHAGTHKTGSTSIQFMLYESTKAAAELGIKVIWDHPTHRGQATNCSSMAHAFVRSEVWSPVRMEGQPLVGHFGSEKLSGHFDRQFSGGYDTYIISAEAFCYLRTREEMELLNRHLQLSNCDVTPLIYFRSAEGWRQSWEAQLARNKSVAGFRERHPDKFTLLDDWYFDKSAIGDFWRAISPSSLFLDYDKEMAEHESVIPSFLEAVGLPQSLNSERYFLNRAPTGT